MQDSLLDRALRDRREAIARAERAEAALEIARGTRDLIDMEARRGTRAVLIAEGVFEHFAARTFDGRTVTVAWGEPDEFGFYTPTFTEHEP